MDTSATEQHWISGAVAVVTGGASGIGRSISLEAARRGALVVIADIDEVGAQETLAQISEWGGEATFYETDVTREAEVRALAARATALGPVRYLANSAGLQTYGTAETTSEELWDRTLDVNLKGIYLTCRHFIPSIRASGGGGIVNISSIQGLRCQRNVLAYATSKGAVVAMTRSLGLDHAAEGIFVNCICPGSIDTPLLRYCAAQHGELGQVLKDWGNQHPIGRIGTAEEIAKCTMFLWSPDSNFIVGQAIVADGGLGSIIL